MTTKTQKPNPAGKSGKDDSQRRNDEAVIVSRIEQTKAAEARMSGKIEAIKDDSQRRNDEAAITSRTRGMAGRPITLYVDGETAELIERHKDKNINLSHLLQKALKGYYDQIQEINDELPCPDMIEDIFKGLPSIKYIREINEQLPTQDMIEDIFKDLPSVEHIQEINDELDETIKKLERIKELESHTHGAGED